MEAHRTVLRVVTEAVNDQFCCLLYLAMLFKDKHHLFLETGGAGGGGGGGGGGGVRGGGKGEEVEARNGLL